MNRAQTRSFLGHLCALFPHAAPHSLDPALVRIWHESALHDVPGDLAFEIADLLEVTWESVAFPPPAAFNELRRNSRALPLGAIDSARSGLIAARAALAAAAAPPVEQEAAVA